MATSICQVCDARHLKLPGILYNMLINNKLLIAYMNVLDKTL